jgi:hypothetical protein
MVTCGQSMARFISEHASAFFEVISPMVGVRAQTQVDPLCSSLAFVAAPPHAL